MELPLVSGARSGVFNQSSGNIKICVLLVMFVLLVNNCVAFTIRIDDDSEYEQYRNETIQSLEPIEFSNVIQRTSVNLILFNELRSKTNLNAVELTSLANHISEKLSKYSKNSRNTLAENTLYYSSKILLYMAATEALENELAFKDSVRSWSEQILKNQFFKLSELAADKYIEFKEIFPQIVLSIYDQGHKNTAYILDFISLLPANEKRIFAYNTLFEALKFRKQLSSPESILLGYQIRKLLQHSQVNQLDKDRLLHIKGQMPDSLKVLLFCESARIRNVKFNEYLYAEKSFDPERRIIFTKAVKNFDDYLSSWKITLHQEGKFIKILNKAHNETLYDAYPSILKPYRSPFTWNGSPCDNTQCEWTLESTSSGEHFRIKNIYYPEYLYASDTFEPRFDSTKERNVFTKEADRNGSGGVDAEIFNWAFEQDREQDGNENCE